VFRDLGSTKFHNISLKIFLLWNFRSLYLFRIILSIAYFALTFSFSTTDVGKKIRAYSEAIDIYFIYTKLEKGTCVFFLLGKRDMRAPARCSIFIYLFIYLLHELISFRPPSNNSINIIIVRVWFALIWTLNK